MVKDMRSKEILSRYLKLLFESSDFHESMNKIRDIVKDDEVANYVKYKFYQRLHLIDKECKKIINYFNTNNFTDYNYKLHALKDKLQKDHDITDYEFKFLTKHFHSLMFGKDKVKEMNETNVMRILGKNAVALKDRYKKDSDEFKELQKILKLYVQSKETHAQIFKQGIQYNDCDARSLMGQRDFTNKIYLPNEHVHPILFAMFIPKITIFEEVFLFSNLPRIIKNTYNGDLPEPGPDKVLFNILTKDPSDVVCDNESIITDLNYRAQLQATLWKSVLYMRNGVPTHELYKEFMDLIDVCRLNKYDTPDLVYGNHDGVVLKRLFSSFAFSPTTVTTMPSMENPSNGNVSTYVANPYAYNQIVAKRTKIPIIHLTVIANEPLRAVGVSASGQDDIRDLYHHPQFFNNHGTIVKRQTKLEHSEIVLVYHVNRKAHHVGYDSIMTNSVHTNYPISAQLEKINTTVINIPSELNLNGKGFKLRSAVCTNVGTYRGHTNIALGSYAIVLDCCNDSGDDSKAIIFDPEYNNTDHNRMDRDKHTIEYDKESIFIKKFDYYKKFLLQHSTIPQTGGTNDEGADDAAEAKKQGEKAVDAGSNAAVEAAAKNAENAARDAENAAGDAENAAGDAENAAGDAEHAEDWIVNNLMTNKRTDVEKMVSEAMNHVSDKMNEVKNRAKSAKSAKELTKTKATEAAEAEDAAKAAAAAAREPREAERVAAVARAGVARERAERMVVKAEEAVVKAERMVAKAKRMVANAEEVVAKAEEAGGRTRRVSDLGVRKPDLEPRAAARRGSDPEEEVARRGSDPEVRTEERTGTEVRARAEVRERAGNQRNAASKAASSTHGATTDSTQSHTHKKNYFDFIKNNLVKNSNKENINTFFKSITCQDFYASSIIKPIMDADKSNNLMTVISKIIPDIDFKSRYQHKNDKQIFENFLDLYFRFFFEKITNTNIDMNRYSEKKDIISYFNEIFIYNINSIIDNEMYNSYHDNSSVITGGSISTPSKFNINRQDIRISGGNPMTSPYGGIYDQDIEELSKKCSILIYQEQDDIERVKASKFDNQKNKYKYNVIY